MTREERIIRTLGATRLFAGYPALLRCIRLACENENRLLSIESNIYAPVAAETGSTVPAIKRNMDTLIQYCWHKTSPQLWEQLASCPIKRCPTVGEFIEIVAWHILDHPQP